MCLYYVLVRPRLGVDRLLRNINADQKKKKNEVGDREFQWIREFGSAWKLNGCFGEERLMVADPKAIHYILHASGYNFYKSPDRVKLTELITGKGLSCAQGQSHERQRKIMNPVFAVSQLKTFLPIFQDSASRLANKWKDEISTEASGQSLISVSSWLSRTTLDIIGEAGFDFHFGSLDDAAGNAITRLYANLFVDSMLYPSAFDLLFKSTWRYIPEPLLNFVQYLPSREYRRFRAYLDYVREFARHIIARKAEKGDGADLMSVLLRKNMSESPDKRITQRELVDQLSTLVLAGQETTASSLNWFLWEISRHPECQQRVRDEVIAMRRRTHGAELTITDLEGLTYTQAALKESMRLHPIIWTLPRVAGKDELIPLAFPVTTKSGEQVSAIPVKRGTVIDIAIHAYQRLPEVWGKDAHEWNPERFMSPEKGAQASVGILKTNTRLAGGVQGCIGWRFSVLEMLVIIATLLEHFEFTLPPQSEATRVQRKPTVVMMPMAAGHPGAWMGLVVRPLH
ncbi:cytochrome P450 [Gloeopeniophorella convolvens]|nr:cytochrome P450 [Gloeopeniophorella convolvens]